MKKLSLAIIVMLVMFSGCYYEDGPIISLRTPETRLVNKWKFHKYMINGQDITSTYANSWIEFKDDKSATFYDNPSYIYFATWEFDDDYKTLYCDCIDSAGNVWSQDYEISKLRDKELWMKYSTGSLTHNYELIEY